MLTHRAASCVVALLALGQVAQADVTGPATVIDGDTIVVAGERIRLEGIDAPELHQTCTAYGQPWACGRTSAEWLQEHLNGRQVECVSHARDRYGPATRGLLRRRRERQRAPGARGLGAGLPQVLGGLPAGGI